MKVEIELDDEMISWIEKNYHHAPSLQYVLRDFIAERINRDKREIEK